MTTISHEDVQSRGCAPRTTAGHGILPYQALEAMVHSRAIRGAPDAVRPEQIQPASIDLRLGRTAYRVRASFLPGKTATVIDKIEQLDGYPIDISGPGGAVLETGCVYVVPLQESLSLPPDLLGIANPKSSTGRLGILTRLITDQGADFDLVASGYHGPLYAEVSPQLFSVVVRQGTRLNQLRFQRGDPSVDTAQLQALYQSERLVRPAAGESLHVGDIKNGLVPLTIDLVGAGAGAVIAYRAKKHTDRIDLEKVGHYDAADFWDAITSPDAAPQPVAMVLDPGGFYILMTREQVGVPPDYAAELVPYHTRSGEMRAHYAGYGDPLFGHQNGVLGGSRLVLEVRPHDVPFILEHGQTVGWLRYERMAERPHRLYGADLQSHYQNQNLALAKQFRRQKS